MNVEAFGLSRTARSRFARIYDTIRNRICLLDYAPGLRLSEEALAVEFGTSRTPVRRVLARLESEGLLKSVHGVGTFVTDIELDELDQTFRLRLELAGLLGQLDPVAPPPTLIAEMRELAHRARALKATPEPRRFAQLNRDYFRALLDLTANGPLRAISEQLYFRTSRIWLKSAFASVIDLREEVDQFLPEVEGVLRALDLGDLHAAALIHRAHVALSFERLRRRRLSRPPES